MTSKPTGTEVYSVGTDCALLPLHVSIGRVVVFSLQVSDSSLLKNPNRLKKCAAFSFTTSKGKRYALMSQRYNFIIIYNNYNGMYVFQLI